MTNPQQQAENERLNTLIEQFKQPTKAEIDANLSKALMNNPSDVLLNIQTQTRQQMTQQFKPALKSHALLSLQSKPGFADAYKLESVREIVDPYIDEQLDMYGSVSDEALNSLSSKIGKIINEVRTTPVKNEVAKKKISTVETKSLSGEVVHKSSLDILNEKIEMAKRGGKERQQYYQWTKTDEGKRIIKENTATRQNTES